MPQDTEPNSDAIYARFREPSELSESQHSEVEKDAAINKMKKLAQKIYDTTPGIAERKLNQTCLRVKKLNAAHSFKCHPARL